MRRLAQPLMYAGIVAIVLGFSKYHAEYVGEYDFTNSFRFLWALAYSMLLSVAAYGLGLPDIPRTLRSRLPTSLAAAGVGGLAISALQLFVGDALLPRLVVLGSACLAVPWFYLVSTVAGAGRRGHERRDRVVVVGPDSLAAELRDELRGSPEKPASVVAQLTESAASDVSERRRPLIDLVAVKGASVIVLSAVAQSDDCIVDQAAVLHEHGVRVRTKTLFYEEWLGKIPVTDLGRVSLFFDIGEVHRLRFGRFKRLLDLVAGSVGLAVVSLLLLPIWVGNLLGNRGPLFYTQDRIGRGGHVFRIVKFRSMRQVDDQPSDWTVEGDIRVTPFGRLLRASHIDELPQVWNIIKGDLSLVGPRPEQPRYVKELVEKIPFYDLRHIVRPGLTGWAQVKFGYAGDERDALEKLQYDFHYLRRQSILFDLRIVGRTARAVLTVQGKGR